ncbi:hypothetical protein [Streptosporangium lutulentum]|uniref:Uncharacterized protein n=1 Tax=Streptosporangium lutulentum TaxID=1461250 RepID=A0ABT9Q2T1_9ACTN|nr:hypothetical protein [Streptosporangium lutulentum]MDP9841030.1 hypothetical protein [Streptosporangium lutulentum]
MNPATADPAGAGPATGSAAGSAAVDATGSDAAPAASDPAAPADPVDPVGADPADPAGVDPTPADPAVVDPADLDDTTVEALGRLSEALETTERARGHLYSFHQLTGHADLQLDLAVELLRASGHAEQADALANELIGRNVLPDRWTFQVVEEYEDGYYRFFADLEKRIRDQLAGGRRHLHEARMKERRRGTEPRPGP